MPVCSTRINVLLSLSFFFFQAEDGIRDLYVTGVQTCALPILDLVGERWLPPRLVEDLAHFRWDGATVKVDWAVSGPMPWKNPAAAGAGTVHLGRSEERRVGKECRARGSPWR